MNKIVKTPDNLPQLQHVYASVAEVLDLWSMKFGISRESDLATFDAVVPKAQAMLADLQADQEPASKPEIATHVTNLAGCFSSGSASGEIYARNMMEDIAERQPPICELKFACRKMRQTRTSQWQPTIAEVLNALSAAKEHREDIIRQLTSITSIDRNQLVQAAEQEHRRMNPRLKVG